MIMMVKISRSKHITKQGTVKKNPVRTGVKIVMPGLLMRDKAEEKIIVDGFAKAGLKIKILGQFRTASGQGGSGGRNDVVAVMYNPEKGAVHPMHLGGLFRWADDYFDNNKGIIPKKAKDEFFKGAGYHK